MSYIYSHSYVDPDTGQVVDVMVADEQDEDIRNAAPWERRWSGGRRPGGTRRPFPFPRPVPRMPRPSRPPAGIPRPQADSPDFPPYVPAGPVIVREPTRPDIYQPTREHIAIRKDAIIELIPAMGQLWASFLGRPAMPKATGENITDRDNASLHRDSLARHAQNQTRILALTDLAARALRVILE